MLKDETSIIPSIIKSVLISVTFLAIRTNSFPYLEDENRSSPRVESEFAPPEINNCPRDS